MGMSGKGASLSELSDEHSWLFTPRVAMTGSDFFYSFPVKIFRWETNSQSGTSLGLRIDGRSIISPCFCFHKYM